VELFVPSHLISQATNTQDWNAQFLAFVRNILLIICLGPSHDGFVAIESGRKGAFPTKGCKPVLPYGISNEVR
jgi:hypothetical protein